MKKKKIIFTMSILAASIAALSSCGGSKKSNKNNNDNSQTESSVISNSNGESNSDVIAESSKLVACSDGILNINFNDKNLIDSFLVFDTNFSYFEPVYNENNKIVSVLKYGYDNNNVVYEMPLGILNDSFIFLYEGNDFVIIKRPSNEGCVHGASKIKIKEDGKVEFAGNAKIIDSDKITIGDYNYEITDKGYKYTYKSGENEGLYNVEFTDKFDLTINNQDYCDNVKEFENNISFKRDGKTVTINRNSFRIDSIKKLHIEPNKVIVTLDNNDRVLKQEEYMEDTLFNTLSYEFKDNHYKKISCSFYDMEYKFENDLLIESKYDDGSINETKYTYDEKNILKTIEYYYNNYLNQKIEYVKYNDLYLIENYYDYAYDDGELCDVEYLEYNYDDNYYFTFSNSYSCSITNIENKNLYVKYGEEWAKNHSTYLGNYYIYYDTNGNVTEGNKNLSYIDEDGNKVSESYRFIGSNWFLTSKVIKDIVISPNIVEQHIYNYTVGTDEYSLQIYRVTEDNSGKTIENKSVTDYYKGDALVRKVVSIEDKSNPYKNIETYYEGSGTDLTLVKTFEYTYIFDDASKNVIIEKYEDTFNSGVLNKSIKTTYSYDEDYRTSTVYNSNDGETYSIISKEIKPTDRDKETIKYIYNEGKISKVQYNDSNSGRLLKEDIYTYDGYVANVTCNTFDNSVSSEYAKKVLYFDEDYNMTYEEVYTKGDEGYFKFPDEIVVYENNEISEKSKIEYTVDGNTIRRSINIYNSNDELVDSKLDDIVYSDTSFDTVKSITKYELIFGGFRVVKNIDYNTNTYIELKYDKFDNDDIYALQTVTIKDDYSYVTSIETKVYLISNSSYLIRHTYEDFEYDSNHVLVTSTLTDDLIEVKQVNKYSYEANTKTVLELRYDETNTFRAGYKKVYTYEDGNLISETSSYCDKNGNVTGTYYTKNYYYTNGKLTKFVEDFGSSNIYTSLYSYDSDTEYRIIRTNQANTFTTIKYYENDLLVKEESQSITDNIEVKEEAIYTNFLGEDIVLTLKSLTTIYDSDLETVLQTRLNTSKGLPNGKTEVVSQVRKTYSDGILTKETNYEFVNYEDSLGNQNTKTIHSYSESYDESGNVTRSIDIKNNYADDFSECSSKTIDILFEGNAIYSVSTTDEVKDEDNNVVSGTRIIEYANGTTETYVFDDSVQDYVLEE